MCGQLCVAPVGPLSYSIEGQGHSRTCSISQNSDPSSFALPLGEAILALTRRHHWSLRTSRLSSCFHGLYQHQNTTWHLCFLLLFAKDELSPARTTFYLCSVSQPFGLLRSLLPSQSLHPGSAISTPDPFYSPYEYSQDSF